MAVYADSMDPCYVGAERARPQPGGFYGSGVTKGVVGPFEDELGTEGW